MNDTSTSKDTWRAWQSAKPLCVAWRFMADPELLSQWRLAEEVHPKAVHRKEIELDIEDRLATGQLTAFGLETGADANGNCIVIPPTFFASDTCEIDWTHGELRSLGRTLADVRVAPTPERAIIGSHSLMPSATVAPTGKGGRTNTYPMSSTVLHELFEIEANRSLSAEKLHPEFERAFAARFPRSLYLIDPPMVRTLRKHLNDFRRQPAETGKN